MVNLHFAVPVILAAAVVAGCLSYLIAPLDRVETDVRLPPRAVLNSAASNSRASTRIETLPNADDLAAAAFEKAAEAILRRAPDTQASIGRDEPPIAGPVPLPRRRPIAR
jgi:hypothetical protein